jgi:hypothetical protein
MSPLDPDAHFARLADLLELEAQAEARQVAERVQRPPPAEAEASGHALVDLVALGGEPGLGGRFLLALGKRGGGYTAHGASWRGRTVGLATPCYRPAEPLSPLPPRYRLGETDKPTLRIGGKVKLTPSFSTTSRSPSHPRG